jgi:23S rRNA (adenine2503-C2)-methyltransferase
LDLGCVNPLTPLSGFDMPKPQLLDLTYTQLKELMVSLGEKPYRADQLMSWIFKKQVYSYEEMSDLSQPLRESLIKKTCLFSLTLLEESLSKDKQTLKTLFRLADAKTIESTLMYYKRSGSGRERRTVCVSTQVGCPIGCAFCATGRQGFERNLSPGEIIEQVLFFSRLVKEDLKNNGDGKERNYITNVVLMGMGEPLANYENVRQAISVLNSPKGLALGIRQITLSTSGLVPQILQLAEEDLHLELAISLHAVRDELRDLLVPVNKKYPVHELILACKEYFRRTGRRPTFEYALFRGVNDSAAAADDLIALLSDFNCSVNLIVGNPVENSEFRPSAMAQALAFQKRLVGGGIRTMIRVSKGSDIQAGCGQLRSRWLDK